MYGIRQNVERWRAAEKLKETQEQLKATILNAPIGMATSDANMFFLSANEAFCKILGFSESELQKKTFKEITYSEDLNSSAKKMGELISGNIHYFSQEKRYVRKDGSIIDGKVMVSAILGSNSKPKLFVIELEDITDRKQAEAKLMGTLEVLERASASVDAGLAVIGKDYRVIWANKRLMELGVAPDKKCYPVFNRLETVALIVGSKKSLNKTFPRMFVNIKQ